MTSAKRKWVVLGLVVLALAVALGGHWRLLDFFRGALQRFLDLIAGLGGWGPIVFVVVYVLACLFLIPVWGFTLGAGALFGLVKGTALAVFSATLGATAAFLTSRRLARKRIARRIAGKPVFEAIDRAVEQQGWKIVFLTRLSPVLSFTLLNYAFGLTRISLRGYVSASFTGLIPATAAYVYVGTLARVSVEGASTAEWIVRVIGLIVTIVVTIILTRIARKALNQFRN